MRQDGEELLRAIAVLHVGGGDHRALAQAHGVDQDLSLAAFDLLMRVKAVALLVRVVLTECRSMIPALRRRCVAAAAWTSPRKRSCLTGQVPHPDTIGDSRERQSSTGASPWGTCARNSHCRAEIKSH